MNFTREPLVETVISAKDGHKLALRNSKGGSQEEFFVDAVEVITFGNSSFYRSSEKPKSFLVPVNDYEILEVRETRMVLKNAAVERVKIGGGRSSESKPPREEAEDVDRPRRRTRKRRTTKDDAAAEPAEEKAPLPPGESPTLIPPPSTLISETISRYKEEPQASNDEEIPF